MDTSVRATKISQSTAVNCDIGCSVTLLHQAVKTDVALNGRAFLPANGWRRLRAAARAFTTEQVSQA